MHQNCNFCNVLMEANKMVKYYLESDLRMKAIWKLHCFIKMGVPEVYPKILHL